MAQWLRIREIRRQYLLPELVKAAVLRLDRKGDEYVARCPFHDERSPSFTIYAGGQRFKCFGCGAGGDVLDFIQRQHHVSLRQAASMLVGGAFPPTQAAPIELREQRNKVAEARAIWASAGPIRGTVAERYLRERGLILPLPPSLRATSLRYGKTGSEHPVLLAAVCDPTGELMGVHRIFLNSSGSGKANVPKPKLSLGRIAGGAIRLAPPSGPLVVAEGIEDALTVQQERGQPTWAAGGASMLPVMQFPLQVRSVIIAADADETGRRQARDAAEAFASRGLKARTIFPRGGKDFNDELLKARR